MIEKGIGCDARMNKIDWGWILMICFFALVFVTMIVIPFIQDDSDKNITFNVVGVKEGINATTITQIHLECIKWCTQHSAGDSMTRYCWAECEKLGGECK